MATIDIIETPQGEKLRLQCTLIEQAQANRIPGANWSDSQDGWVIPVSEPACQIAEHLFPGIQAGPALAARRPGWQSKAAWRSHLSQLVELPPDGTPGYEWLSQHTGWVAEGAYRFQATDAAWLALDEGGIVANEPGLGKTISAISALAVLGEGALPALVVCPASVKAVWARELAKWAPALRVSVVAGTVTKRRKALAADADVYVVGWQSLRFHTRLAPYGSQRMARCPEHGGEWKPAAPDAEREPMIAGSKCEAHLRELNSMPLKTVILDEAHRLIHPESKQTRAAWWVAWQAEHRIALTGTPTGDTIEDLWPVLYAVAPKAFPVKGAFMELFAVQQHKFWGGFEMLGLKPETRDLYYAVTAPYMRRVQKKAVLANLPEKVFEYRYPEMSAAQRKAYAEMRDEMLARLDEIVVAPNPLTQAMRLSSFAAAMPKAESAPCPKCKASPGWQANPDWLPHWPQELYWQACAKCDGTSTVQVIDLTTPSCKVDDLMEFMDDEGQRPLVVSSESKKLLRLVAEKMTAEKMPHVSLTGNIGEAERAQVVAQFQDGKVPVMLLTPQAGGEGITLTKADTIFVMVPSFNARANLQVIDRVHRIGSEVHDSIRIITQVVPGTVDEHKEEVLAGKAGRIDEVTRDSERLRWLLGG